MKDKTVLELLVGVVLPKGGKSVKERSLWLAGVLVLVPACLTLMVVGSPGKTYEEQARDIAEATGAQGGLIVHLGCGDGRLTAELAALRRELRQYEQRIRLRDVLGGIGYIVGMAGVAFYFLGVRRRQSG